jgi:hypothetical protein
VFAYVFHDIVYVGNKKCIVTKVGYDKNNNFVSFRVHVVTSLWFMWKDIDERCGCTMCLHMCLVILRTSVIRNHCHKSWI